MHMTFLLRLAEARPGELQHPLSRRQMRLGLLVYTRTWLLFVYLAVVFLLVNRRMQLAHGAFHRHTQVIDTAMQIVFDKKRLWFSIPHAFVRQPLPIALSGQYLRLIGGKINIFNMGCQVFCARNISMDCIEVNICL